MNNYRYDKCEYIEEYYRFYFDADATVGEPPPSEESNVIAFLSSASAEELAPFKT
jgi:hypothetical protein